MQDLRAMLAMRTQNNPNALSYPTVTSMGQTATLSRRRSLERDLPSKKLCRPQAYLSPGTFQAQLDYSSPATDVANVDTHVEDYPMSQVASPLIIPSVSLSDHFILQYKQAKASEITTRLEEGFVQKRLQYEQDIRARDTDTAALRVEERRLEVENTALHGYIIKLKEERDSVTELMSALQERYQVGTDASISLRERLDVETKTVKALQEELNFGEGAVKALQELLNVEKDNTMALQVNHTKQTSELQDENTSLRSQLKAETIRPSQLQNTLLDEDHQVEMLVEGMGPLFDSADSDAFNNWLSSIDGRL